LASEALKLAEEIDAANEILSSLKVLYLNYRIRGEYKASLLYFERFHQLTDSLKNEDSKNELIRKEYEHDYEMRAFEDSIARSKESEIKNLEIAEQKAQLELKKNQQILLFGGLSLFVIFFIVVYRRYQISRKQNMIIEKQKGIVEEKHREITDSINYAERIQRSFLATEDVLNEKPERLLCLFQP
jgi:hypothetical protein